MSPAPVVLSEPSDMELLQRVVERDTDAFARLYDRFAPVLFSLSVRILRDARDAEDVLQEVFIQVWRDARRFEPNRASVRSWLCTIARSRSLDRYRSRRSADLRVEAESDELLERRGGAAPQEASLLKQYIAKQLARLNDGERKVLKLAYFGGYTQEEIAGLLKEPLGTIKSRARSGLMKLSTFLSSEESRG